MAHRGQCTRTELQQIVHQNLESHMLEGAWPICIALPSKGQQPCIEISTCWFNCIQARIGALTAKIARGRERQRQRERDEMQTSQPVLRVIWA